MHRKLITVQMSSYNVSTLWQMSEETIFFAIHIGANFSFSSEYKSSRLVHCSLYHAHGHLFYFPSLLFILLSKFRHTQQWENGKLYLYCVMKGNKISTPLSLYSMQLTIHYGFRDACRSWLLGIHTACWTSFECLLLIRIIQTIFYCFCGCSLRCGCPGQLSPLLTPEIQHWSGGDDVGSFSQLY